MAGEYPIQILKRFSNIISKNLSEMKILIIGVAFKGVPDTNDTRGSTSLDVFRSLKGKVSSIYGWDAVIQQELLQSLGFEKYTDIGKVINNVDAILILNNNPKNIISSIYDISHKDRRVLIFDGWHQFDRLDIERNKNLIYSTMGYLSDSIH